MASAADFDFTAGLSVSFDIVDTGTAGASQYWWGVNNGTSSAPGRGAGFVLAPFSQVLNLFLNGASVLTLTGVPLGLHNYKIKIRTSGIVEYYRDGVRLYTSVASVSFASPRGIWFESNEWIIVDNVLVTAP